MNQHKNTIYRVIRTLFGCYLISTGYVKFDVENKDGKFLIYRYFNKPKTTNVSI